MKSLDNAREHLPAGAPLSVTASPVKGLEETQRLTEEFQAAGFEPVPTSRRVWCATAPTAPSSLTGCATTA